MVMGWIVAMLVYLAAAAARAAAIASRQCAATTRCATAAIAAFRSASDALVLVM
jgi:hypothetical protein